MWLYTVQLNSNLTVVFDYSQVFRDFFESLINDRMLFACHVFDSQVVETDYFTNLYTNLLMSPAEKDKHKPR